jgi:hypothetical protein
MSLLLRTCGMHKALNILREKVNPRPDFKGFEFAVFDPVVDGGFGNLEDGTDFSDLVKRLAGHSWGFAKWYNKPLFFDSTDLFPDNQPDGLPELFRIVRKEHRSSCSFNGH